jgi:hypothetical protein
VVVVEEVMVVMVVVSGLEGSWVLIECCHAALEI